MRTLTIVPVVVLLSILVACSGQQNESTPTPSISLDSTPIPYETTDPASLQVVSAQRIYVPAYSLIATSDGTSTRTLATTLAIHNVSQSQPIILTSIAYHNGVGEMVNEYVESGLTLPPLATITMLVRQDDLSGGVGANFTVEWVAEDVVSPPVVETIMVSTTGNQGLSFTSRGVVVEVFEDFE